MMYNSPSARLLAAQQYLAERAARNPKLTPSRTLTNATTKGTYTGNAMQSPRADAGLPSLNGRGV